MSIFCIKSPKLIKIAIYLFSEENVNKAKIFHLVNTKSCNILGPRDMLRNIIEHGFIKS